MTQHDDEALAHFMDRSAIDDEAAELGCLPPKLLRQRLDKARVAILRQHGPIGQLLVHDVRPERACDRANGDRHGS